LQSTLINSNSGHTTSSPPIENRGREDEKMSMRKEIFDPEEDPKSTKWW
jgi:hypothetical protein